jgi:hypothetical protein
MAVLRMAYLDESGKENDPEFAGLACCVAGYIGTADAWGLLEQEWQGVLDDFGVPYFHMKEYAHSKVGSPFASWKKDESIRTAFMSSLVSTLHNKSLHGIAALVSVPDLTRFNQEFGLSIAAYPLGLYATMVHAAQEYPSDKISFVLDRLENHTSLVAIARSYADSDRYHQDCGRNIEIFPSNKNLSSKNCKPLQAADLIAYEVVKAHKWKAKYLARGISRNIMDFWQEESLSSLKNKGDGGIPPRERESYEALIEATPIDGFLWDYELLCLAHNARGGAWKSA